MTLTLSSSYADERGFKIMQKVDKQSKAYQTQTSEVYMLITDHKENTRKDTSPIGRNAIQTQSKVS